MEGVKISEPQVQAQLFIYLLCLFLFPVCCSTSQIYIVLFTCREHFIYSLISVPTTEKKLKDLVELKIPSPFVNICWIRAR